MEKKIIVGTLLVGFAAVSLDSILNTKTGSFVDPQRGEKYNYSLLERGDSRHVFAWDDKYGMPIFSLKIRDFDADGTIDHIGTPTYPRLPFEFDVLERSPPYCRERAQRLYDLALADSQEVS